MVDGKVTGKRWIVRARVRGGLGGGKLRVRVRVRVRSGGGYGERYSSVNWRRG